jgi:hypothetical protein
MALPESLPAGVRAKLEAASLTTIEALAACSGRDLLDVRGIGRKALGSIEKVLSDHGLGFAEDEWAPYTCAREAKPSMDTQLSSMFLCDKCAADFQKLAFNGTEPSYLAEEVEGYCLHCNKLRQVRLRQWYLCGVCDRVMRSIGRSVVADRYVLDWWNESVQREVPHLRLSSVDEPKLRPRRKGGAAKVPSVDFIGEDQNDKPEFGIELKTGRSYISGRSIGPRMQRFQLDHGDCDDITSVVKSMGLLPVYLFHAQVIDRTMPPTVRFVGVGLWWTDLPAMEENYITSARRPREAKTAAYYDRKMFRGSANFAEHLADGGPARLRQLMQSEGIPALYKS